MKQIHVIEMGGTISAKGLNRLDLKDYTSGKIHGDDFLRDLPELNHLAHLSFHSFSNISSTKITPSDWIHLREYILSKLEQTSVDGIVISHGTSTLEETAYFLHLTVPTKKPIVLVGAQRPYTAISSDAQMNLIQAIRVAASEEAIGKGVLVVTNDEISCARDVTKQSTYRLDTFQSSKHGFLGVVDPDHSVQFYREPVRAHTYKSSLSQLHITDLPEVAIVYSYAGASSDMIDAIVQSEKFKGIVVAGTGAGLVSPAELEALQRATRRGIVVVRSSRVGNGRVVPIKPFENKPFIAGDDLLPQKARILLMLSLFITDDLLKIQNMFNTY